MYIPLNKAVSISSGIPYNWYVLYPEVAKQLEKDGYRVMGNPETDNPYDVVVRK